MSTLEEDFDYTGYLPNRKGDSDMKYLPIAVIAITIVCISYDVFLALIHRSRNRKPSIMESKKPINVSRKKKEQ